MKWKRKCGGGEKQPIGKQVTADNKTESKQTMKRWHNKIEGYVWNSNKMVDTKINWINYVIQ